MGLAASRFRLAALDNAECLPGLGHKGFEDILAGLAARFNHSRTLPSWICGARSGFAGAFSAIVSNALRVLRPATLGTGWGGWGPSLSAAILGHLPACGT